MNLSRISTILAVCAASVALFVSAYSQAKPGGAKPPGTASQKNWQGGMRRGPGMGMGMFDKLNLTPAQKTKLKALQEAQMKQFQALRNQKLTEDQRRAKMKALHDDWMKKVDAILTPAQRKQLADMRKKAMEQFKNRGGGTKPAPGGKGGG